MLTTFFNLQPVLESDLVILRPLKEDDFDALYEVASDPLIWEQHPAKERSQRAGFELFFNDAIKSQGAFLVIDKASGKAIGSTRFHEVKESQNAIEIGWTFLAKEYWGGRYNRSMKHLMMEYAFSFVDHILFYIHENNIRSQEAVKRIGGERIFELDGQILEGRPTASVIYCITGNKWQRKA